MPGDGGGAQDEAEWSEPPRGGRAGRGTTMRQLMKKKNCLEWSPFSLLLLDLRHKDGK